MPTLTQGTPSIDVVIPQGNKFEPPNVEFSPATVLGGATVTVWYQPVNTTWWSVVPSNKALAVGTIGADGYGVTINARCAQVRVVATGAGGTTSIPFVVN